MKNILVIAYYYPPKGGSGVQRIAKFAKYLSKLGYNVNVLTVKEGNEGILDESLKDDIKYGVKVYRTDIRESHLLDRVIASSKPSGNVAVQDSSNKENKIINTIKKIIRSWGKSVFLSIYNLFNVPDDKKGWINFGVEEGKKIIKDEKIDLIISTSAPYSAHIIAYKLSKASGIKWVADFRDQWVTNPFANYNFMMKKIYGSIEKKIIKNAYRVLSVSGPIIDDFNRRYSHESPDKFCEITNGYDEDDFKLLDLSLGDNNEKFVILYNGTLYGNENPEPFFKALDNLITDKKVDAEKIIVKFIGDIGYTQQQYIDKYRKKYPNIVEHKSFMPHKDSLNEICKANALLLLISDLPGCNVIYCGKIFEYIRASKPILGLVPEGVAKDLIHRTNTGYTALPWNVKEIENIIFQSYSNFMSKNVEYKPNWNEIKKYDREYLTKKLIMTIDNPSGGVIK